MISKPSSRTISNPKLSQFRHCEKASRCRWDKSRIIEKLLQDYEVERQTARVIASLVEEKIFSMNMTSVPASLLKQLMLSQAAAVLHAHQQLLTV